MVAKKNAYDFDNWTAEDEEAALAEVREAIQVKYVIVENSFVGRFPDGTEMKLPFSVSIDDIEAVVAAGTEVDGLKILFERIAGTEAADTFASQPLPSATDFAAKYFGLFRKITGVDLGE